MRLARVCSTLLRRLVDASFADAVIGDLLEERSRRIRAGHPARASVWFWRECLRVTARVAGATVAASTRRYLGRALTMARLGSDLRLAIRSLRATPAFTVVALAVLTLGIGATTSIFSVVDAVVLRGLPFDEGDRLVAVSESANGSRGLVTIAPRASLYVEWQTHQDVFTGLAAVAAGDLTLTRDGDIPPAILAGERVGVQFFDILHARPFAGRTFTTRDGEDVRENVAVISYGLWQRRFGGAGVIGRPLRTPDRTITIVGVMPDDFEHPVGANRPTEVWTPFVVPPAGAQGRSGASYRIAEIVGRLRPGVSIAEAQAHMDRVMAGLAARAPAEYGQGRGVLVEPLRGAIVEDVRPWMLLLLGAVVCVLAIACANVANLTLVRTATRTRELGVRAALGATRWDLARPLLIESLMLAGAGTALGVLVAVWGVEALRSALPAGVPRAAAIGVNLRVLAAAGSAAIVTGVLFGLAPVAQFSRPNTSDVLKDRGRANTPGGRRRWVGPVLIVAEVALAVVLAVGAALFITSFSRVASVDIGVDVRDVWTVPIAPWLDRSNTNGLRAQVDAAGQQLERVTERIAALPGVEAAALFHGIAPLNGETRVSSTPVSIPGHEPERLSMYVATMTPGYFRVLGIPVLRGCGFTAEDRATSSPVAMLNAAAAVTYFGSVEAAIGQTILDSGRTPRAVVGVAANIRPKGPEGPIDPEIYFPFAQRLDSNADLMLRTADIAPLVPAIRQAIWSEFPDVGLPEIRSLDSDLHNYTARREFNMLLLTLFGALGLVIASVGLYGVMASQVAQRTQEIGIRMALGALPAHVLRSVLGRAAVYLACGLALGLLGAWMVSGLVGTFLYQIAPTDPRVYAAGAGVLLLVGLIAALVPARRAARVDPVIALRTE